ncbi:hypothetical protein MA16_Dca025628 [Dendrobium catenatum]|uniref:Uncharacterized protein n=1 Tax=Dendrobium catenatum TaxID=906689 RepID=A0A2I0WKX7_9ASPA|nr:hypothetical protein MA16_Dca025628 [Dendrobium catenatum]
MSDFRPDGKKVVEWANSDSTGGAGEVRSWFQRAGLDGLQSFLPIKMSQLPIVGRRERDRARERDRERKGGRRPRSRFLLMTRGCRAMK